MRIYSHFDWGIPTFPFGEGGAALAVTDEVVSPLSAPLTSPL